MSGTLQYYPDSVEADGTVRAAYRKTVFVLEPEDFRRATVRALLALPATQGLLVLWGTPARPQSPEATVPNAGYGTERGFAWNAAGDGLAHEAFRRPIWLAHANVSATVRACALANANRTAYPKYGAVFFTTMSAGTDTETCLRREKCLPLGGQSVLSSLAPLRSGSGSSDVGDGDGDNGDFNNNKNNGNGNGNGNGSNSNESNEDNSESSNNDDDNERETIFATARLDSTAFFHDLVPGADAYTSGLVALLAAEIALHEHLGPAGAAALRHDIVFAYFQGEAYGYLGSRTYVRDLATFACTSPNADNPDACDRPYMASTQFLAPRLARTAAVVDAGQVGLLAAPNASAPATLFVHTTTAPAATETVGSGRGHADQGDGLGGAQGAGNAHADLENGQDDVRGKSDGLGNGNGRRGQDDNAHEDAQDDVQDGQDANTKMNENDRKKYMKRMEALEAALEAAAATPMPEGVPGLQVRVVANATQGLPPSSAMAFVRAAPAVPAAVLADHGGAFANAFYHSHHDAAPPAAARVCGVATLLARTLLYAANASRAPTPAGRALAADCALVAELVACLTVNFKCPLVERLLGEVYSADGDPVVRVSKYVGVFGTSDRRVFVHTYTRLVESLLLNRTHDAAGAACNSSAPCPAGFRCVGAAPHARCLHAHLAHHNAKSPGINYVDGAWRVTDPREPLYTESYWATLSMALTVVDDPAHDTAVLVAGIVLLVLAFAAVYLVDGWLFRAFKLA